MSISGWVDKEKILYICKRILFSLKKEENPATFYKIGESWGHSPKWNKPERGTWEVLFQLGSEFRVCKMKKSGGWLYHRLHVANTIELYAWNMIKMVKLKWFYHNYQEDVVSILPAPVICESVTDPFELGPQEGSSCLMVLEPIEQDWVRSAAEESFILNLRMETFWVHALEQESQTSGI